LTPSSGSVRGTCGSSSSDRASAAKHRGDAGEQQDDADHRPHRRRVRIVLPTSGSCGQLLVYESPALAGGRSSPPRRPEEERGQRLAARPSRAGRLRSSRTARAAWRASGRCRTGRRSARATRWIASAASGDTLPCRRPRRRCCGASRRARRGDDGLGRPRSPLARGDCSAAGSPVSAVGLAVQPVADQSGAT
jgi:hypothetical protein